MDRHPQKAGGAVPIQDYSHQNVYFMDRFRTDYDRGDTEVITPRMPVRTEASRLEVPVFRRVITSDAALLRKAFENAREALAARQGDNDGPFSRQLELAQRERQQFWIDTCRDPREARAAAKQVAELHRQHGWRFLSPTADQVQSVLEALDCALPTWDQDHPGLFFQTLEMNFPGVLRLLPKPRGR